MTEENITGIILSQAKTAKEGVDIVARIMDEKGANDAFQLFINDAKENPGAKLTGWHRLSGHDYYFRPDNGGMVTGKQLIGNTYYLFDSIHAKENPGAKLTGWHRLSGHDYYFQPGNGGMLTGKQLLGKTTYIFDLMSGKTPGAMIRKY